MTSEPVAEIDERRNGSINAMPTSTFDSASKRELTAEQKSWMSKDFWENPEWLENNERFDDRTMGYDDYFLYHLRTKYFELESDFRSTYSNYAEEASFDMSTATRIVELLRVARGALEGKFRRRTNVGSILDLIERFMIWIIPPAMLKGRLVIIENRLMLENQFLHQSVIKTYNDYLSTNEETIALKLIRPLLDESIGEINRQMASKQLSVGLQIRRLQHLRRYSVFVFIALLCFSNIMIGSTTFPTNVKPITMPVNGLDLTQFVYLFCLAGLGSIGAFISGLLQIRNTRVTLAEYKETQINFHLKLLIGAISALLLILLVSWDVLANIKFNSFGTILLLVFLSGFSERYFLGLLKINPNDLEIKRQ